MPRGFEAGNRGSETILEVEAAELPIGEDREVDEFLPSDDRANGFILSAMQFIATPRFRPAAAPRQLSARMGGASSRPGQRGGYRDQRA